MDSVELTKREQLIERILRMSDQQITAVSEFIKSMEIADLLRFAKAESSHDESSMSQDNSFTDANITPEEIEAVARAEGWM